MDKVIQKKYLVDKLTKNAVAISPVGSGHILINKGLAYLTARTYYVKFVKKINMGGHGFVSAAPEGLKSGRWSHRTLGQTVRRDGARVFKEKLIDRVYTEIAEVIILPAQNQTLNKQEVKKSAKYVDNYLEEVKHMMSQVESMKQLEIMLKDKTANISITHNAMSERSYTSHQFMVIDRYMEEDFEPGEKISKEEQEIIDRFKSLPRNERDAEYARLKKTFFSLK